MRLLLHAACTGLAVLGLVACLSVAPSQPVPTSTPAASAPLPVPAGAAASQAERAIRVTDAVVRARVAAARGDSDAAAAAWREVLAIDPAHAQARAELNKWPGARFGSLLGAMTGTVPRAAVAGTDRLPARHVNFEAPDRALPAQTVAVQVWLGDRGPTPGAVVVPPEGTTLRSDGRLPLPLPSARDRWEIDVVLLAPGFEFDDVVGNLRRIVLPRSGGSTPALFTLRASAGESGNRLLRATLWHQGRYLGSVSRSINIGVEQMARHPIEVPSATVEGGSGSAGAPARASTRRPGGREVGGEEEDPLRAPDLYVYLRHDDPQRLGRGQVIISSPHLPQGMASERFELSPDVSQWLAHWHARLNATSQARGAMVVGGQPAAVPPTPQQSVALMRGFGQELYARVAPALFKRALEELASPGRARLTSIQIYSNNPTIPWELMRPGMVKGREIDFLGVEFRIARWHTDGAAAMHDRPVQDIPLREVVVLAPQYVAPLALPAQRDELAFLSRLRGFRRAGGHSDAVRLLARSPPAGIVHFAGHGELRGASAVEREYALRLEDGPLDALAWRGMSRGVGAARSLFFFNACDLGAADAVGGTVAGWAAAVLDSGGGGYIGGLWALHDSAAAAFARRFYEAVESFNVREGTVATDALRYARQLFFETGDPTYLAYVYYGDVNLRLSPP